jgi:hypothetical protein
VIGSNPIFSTGPPKLLKSNNLGGFFLPTLTLNASGTEKSTRPAWRKNQNSSEEKEKNIGYSERKFQGRTPR